MQNFTQLSRPLLSSCDVMLMALDCYTWMFWLEISKCCWFIQMFLQVNITCYISSYMLFIFLVFHKKYYWKIFSVIMSLLFWQNIYGHKVLWKCTASSFFASTLLYVDSQWTSFWLSCYRKLSQIFELNLIAFVVLQNSVNFNLQKNPWAADTRSGTIMIYLHTYMYIL